MDGKVKKLIFIALFFASPVLAEAKILYGLSVFGDLKYGADFKYFDYVNPNASKGGVLASTGSAIKIPNGSALTFDSLNGYILKGNGAQGLELIFDSLMVRSFDEPDAVYGLVAKNVELKNNARAAVFNLRTMARFHNGTKLTAADIVFSLELLKKNGHPLIAFQLKNLKSVREISAERLEVELSSSLKTKTQRMHFLIFMVQLPIFSKDFYTVNDFTKTSQTAPLGSGPYKIKNSKLGLFVNYSRVKNYWARNLPVNKGRWNFDELRFEYFRDRNSEFEAFKAGAYNLREEFTSKTWAKQYNFPAIRDGRVKKLILEDKTPSGAQGWFINLRREKFKNIKTRQALGLAFDFEWTNRNQFYGIYKRTESFFENSPLKAQGLPNKAELKLLNLYRKYLPNSVFGPAILSPKSNFSGQDRNNLRKAAKLLDDAGWVIVQGKRQKNGKPLAIEFMNDTPSFERIVQPFIKNLRILGIDAKLRLVDAAQYQQRLRNFDFDMTTRRFSIGTTPSVELRSFFSSVFSNVVGSNNLSGISNLAIDGLIEKTINAPNRYNQNIAAAALDRALRSLYVWVPQWHNDKHHIAFWQPLGRPKIKPLYARGILDCWFQKEKQE